MPEITLTEEQERVVRTALTPVPVCDSQGNILGQLDPTSEAFIIAEAKRRLSSKQRRIPAERVHAHLMALEEEWKRTGGFDKEYMRAFLDRLRSAEEA